MLWPALTLQLGYNATLVTIGATLLGIAAGITGTFLYLRKRALVSDAISHATLPGIGLAFMAMVAFGFDGRSLSGLLAGSALSALLGLYCVHLLTTRSRLTEDAAIGAVLSVFFGFGVVLLTIIQTMVAGRQAGLEGFLLGSTAGMLGADALVIAIGGALTLAAVLILRRPMTVVSFDPEYAEASGLPVARIDLAIMALALAVTVTGLKVVGLILIVALLIIPPVAARFWSDRVETVALLSGAIGGVSAYTGAALSAVIPNLPTGPMIVLVAFALFVFSLLASPRRGVMAAFLKFRAYQEQVHLRQGLLALAQGQPIYERLTLRLLQRRGLASADGVPTEAGRARAAKALRDEARWRVARKSAAHESASAHYDGLTDIENILTGDQIAELDAQIPGPQEAPA
ncbi:MAG: metal ABC transporter permease [Pseudomonadota bacterium]